MFARKFRIEVLSAEGPQPCPLQWLDSFCMRDFTGKGAFNETLPLADGRIEASFQVDAEALRTEMEDWLTRKFGGGGPVKLSLTEIQT